MEGKFLNFFEVYRVLKIDVVLVSSFFVVDRKVFLKFFNEEFKFIRRVLFFFKIDGKLKMNFGFFYNIVVVE